MTGIYTGRSPKDKYIVMDDNSKDTVWWTSEGYKNDNHPMSEDVWAQVKKLAVSELCNKRLFVVDAFCGANKDTRMAVRFIVEVAWQAHFKMCIRDSIQGAQPCLRLRANLRWFFHKNLGGRLRGGGRAAGEKRHPGAGRERFGDFFAGESVKQKTETGQAL